MLRPRGVNRHRLSMRLLRLRRPLRCPATLRRSADNDLVRQGETGEATGVKKSVGDPVAQKVVEWLILRDPSGDAGFARYAAFIADNPSWPGIRLLRRRAEGRLWQERSDAATVRRFTGGQPASAKGRFALARVLLAEGNRDGAERQVRQAWRSEELSEHVELAALDTSARPPVSVLRRRTSLRDRRT